MGKNKNSLGRSLIKDRFGASKGKKKVDNGSMLHTTEIQDGYDWGRLNLQSVTEESSFQEFLSTAQLAGTEFQAEKLNLKLVSIDSVEAVTSVEARANAEKRHAESKHLLRVPRRPKWTKEMTAEELSDNEKQAFLSWRRDLAVLQEKDGIIMTPYEKNLEFWRQLWRVLERSQLLVQVLDARNPLLFRCEDVESYAKEIGVPNLLLLLNKADLLTPKQRNMWAEYFNAQGVKIAFFSAVMAAEEVKLEKKILEENDGEDFEEEESDEEQSEESGEDTQPESNEVPQGTCDATLNPDTIEGLLDGINRLNEALDKTSEKIKSFENKLVELAEMEPASHIVKTPNTLGVDSDKSTENIDSSDRMTEGCSPQDNQETVKEDREQISKTVTFCSGIQDKDTATDSKQDIQQEIIQTDDGYVNNSEILSRDQLIALFSQIGQEYIKNGERFTVGMVGYPNVGKSSTINGLMKAKKVSVSATPGKTKHFQTLLLSDELMLCDCPGLVLPSFVCTKADMIVHGILPIDQMREYMEATTILAESIGGRKAAERKLGILLPPAPTDNPDYLPPRDMLLAYAYSRGLMTGAGTPDCARAARVLLRAACQGKLSVAVAPPGVNVEDFRDDVHQDDKAIQTRELTPQERRALKSGDSPDDIDNAFFHGPGLKAYAKGVQGKFSGLPKVRVRTINGSALHETEVAGKPWKYFNKHANKKKKEKLRKTYGYLDKH